jgi:hypothetical protein
MPLRHTGGCTASGRYLRVCVHEVLDGGRDSSPRRVGSGGFAYGGSGDGLGCGCGHQPGGAAGVLGQHGGDQGRVARAGDVAHQVPEGSLIGVLPVSSAAFVGRGRRLGPLRQSCSRVGHARRRQRLARLVEPETHPVPQPPQRHPHRGGERVRLSVRGVIQRVQ